jgi:hypothetical protein
MNFVPEIALGSSSPVILVEHPPRNDRFNLVVSHPDKRIKHFVGYVVRDTDDYNRTSEVAHVKRDA